MSLLVLSNVILRIAGRTLLDGANLTIDAHKKVGLIGKNGSGKSSLLRAIIGENNVDGGEIQISNRTRMTYIRQELGDASRSIIDTVLASDTERRDLLDKAAHITDPQQLADIHERLYTIEADSAPARAATILSGLGFSAADQDKPLADFSGGWRMRVALASALFLNPDLLLLDEPTNHLDLEATLWLQNWLQRFNGAALIVSHDREILDKSVSAIAHLHNGKLSLTPGGYDEFVRIRAEKMLHHNREAERIATKRAHMESFVARFRAKATKARQAQARLKALEKMPVLDAIVEDTPVVFTFPETEILPSPMMKAENISLGYGVKTVLSDISFRMDSEDRIALLGANGNGKSTFAKFLSGKLPPLAGSFTHSSKLRVGYFAQHQEEELVTTQTPAQHLLAQKPAFTLTQARSHLARFGLEGQKSETEVGKLSGGEKARLLLALCTLDSPHLLILDEPTNHLDLDARDALIHALADFNGTIILISHDPHLISATANSLWLVHKRRIETFDGDMDDYRKWILEQNRPATSSSSQMVHKKKEERKERSEQRKQLAPVRKQLKILEDELQKLQNKHMHMEEKLADPDLYTTSSGEEIAKLTTDLANIKNKIEQKEEKWLELQEEIEIFL